MKIKPNRISKLVKLKRLELGLSQAELTKLIGWNKNNTQYISNIERGTCSFPPGSIIDFVRATNIDTDTVIMAMVNDYRDSLIGALNKTSQTN